MREDARTKGQRYVAEGRLTIRHVDEDAGVVEAECRGGGAVYRLAHRDGRWACSCPARGRCSHLHALALVIAVEPPTEAA